MKNKQFFTGILSILLVFGSLLASCDMKDSTYAVGDSTYTISYHANGGNGAAPSAQTANAGATITVANQGNLSLSGYIFGGWNTLSNGYGTSYAAGSSMTVNANVTLYAQWLDDSGIIYTVTYNANGASGSAPSTQTVNAGVSITVANQGDLTYSGRTFDGWNTQSNGSGTSYIAGSSMAVNANVTLFAQWTDDSDPGNGSNSGTWLVTNNKIFSVTDGVAGDLINETNTTWLTYNYIDARNRVEEYQTNSTMNTVISSVRFTTYVTTSTQITYNNSITGNTWQSVSHSLLERIITNVWDDGRPDDVTNTLSDDTNTSTIIYDEASGLMQSFTSTLGGGRSDSNYTIELIATGISDKTYKRYDSTTDGTKDHEIFVVNNNGVILESRLYNVDGVLTRIRIHDDNIGYTLDSQYLLESRYYDTNGVLTRTSTHPFPQDAIIRERVPLLRESSSFSEVSQTVDRTTLIELVSYSDTQLTIRTKTFTSGVLTAQTETTYTKWD